MIPRLRIPCLLACILAVMAFIVPATPCGAQDRAADIEAARDAFRHLHFRTAARRFAKLVKEYPDNDTLLAELAVAYRYSDSLELALETARRALAIDSCNAQAHAVIAHCLNPQFSHDSAAHADSAWFHLQRAVTCSPREYNAWLEIVNESLHRGDSLMLHRTCATLHADGFFTPATLAYMRWTLQSLPHNAALLTSGDIDTYSALCLQTVEGLRTDVAVLNHGMLQLPWYARMARDRFGLPLPLEDSDLDSYRVADPAPEESYMRNAVVYLHEKILNYWATGARRGELGRPLTAMHTYAADDLATESCSWILMGPYYVATRRREGPSLDTAAVHATLLQIHPQDIAGSGATSSIDPSPIRADAASSAHTVAWLATQYGRFEFDAGRRAEARWALGLAEELHRIGGSNDDLAEMIEDLRKDIGKKRR